MLLGDHGLLRRIHTADGRTVLLPSLLLGPGSAALDESDLLGCLSGRGDDDVSSVGTGCAHDPLVLDGCHNVLEPSVSVLCCDVCIPDLESGSSDDGSDIECDELILVIVVDCSLLTGLGAVSALVLCEFHTNGGIDDSHPGHCLCVGDVNCLPCCEPELVFVRDVLDRTLCKTVSTAGTLLGVNVPGLLEHCDLEVSCLTLDLLDLVIGQNVNVRVSVTVRHLRREDTCGTIIRRECLVETAHDSTDCGVFLHKVDMNVPVCKIKRRLNTRNSSSDNQCRFTQIIASFKGIIWR